MAIRMQQRRGTSEQWTLANPVLSAGEIGFETDTRQFKMGNGVDRWASLVYFFNSEGLEESLADYVPLDALGDTVATLVNGQVPAAQLPDIGELSQDAVNDALTAGTGITKDYNDAANTLTLAVDTDTIATRAYVDQAETDAVTTANSYTDAEIAAIPAVDLDGYATESFVTDAIADIPATDLTDYATKTYADTAASTAAAALVDSAPAALDTLNELAAALGDDANFATTVSTSLGEKAPINNPTFTGTVAGVTKAHVGLGNVDNTSDAGKPVSTATQTALDLKANLAAPTFTGNVVLPGTTIIGNVSSTELGHLDGVTSAIQTQINGKANTSHTHAISDVTNLQTALDGKVDEVNGAVTTAATNLTVVRNITLSTADPTGGMDGDVWLKYS